MQPRILALILSAWFAPFGSAQDGKPLPSPSGKEYLKEAYVIEKLQTRVSAEADGTGTRERLAEVKILADAGIKAFAVLNFTYSSSNEVVDVDYVRVRKPDGNLVKTPDYNIQDMPADVSRTAPLYSDIHEKHIAVKGLGVGDVLEYLVRFRVVKPEIPGTFWYEDSFIKDAIVKEQILEISLPADKYVKVVSPDFPPAIKNENQRRIYRWTYSNLQLKEKDPNEIPRRIPENPSVQVTTFASWEEVGQWYGNLQNGRLEVTPGIQAKATELTKNLKTDDEKIRAIYTFVSLRFHYIGLDFGIGRYQPHAADDVLENGYGDCKDKHTLLASLLKGAGYDAWPALIHSRRILDPEAPSPAQFNHVITVVPLAGQTLWLDTTPEVAPYRLLLTPLRDKQALVIPSDKPPLLMRTPENPPFPQNQEFSVKGKLSSDGTFTGHVEQSYQGDAEVVFRELFRRASESQWKEVAQGFSYRAGFGGDVSDVHVTPPDDLDKPFELSYDYVRKNYSDWDNRQITPPLPPMGVEITKDFTGKKPVEPIPLGSLGEVEYRAQIELPPGYSASAPAGVDLVEPFAEYHTTNAVENGILTTSRRFKIKTSQIALADWEIFRKFGRSVADDEYSYIRLRGSSKASSADAKNNPDKTGSDSPEDVENDFRDGEAALQSNDSRRAQTSFENVIRKQPDYPGAHFNLGLAFSHQRRAPEAIAAFRKEEEITPTDVRSYMAAASLAAFSGHKEDAIEDWRRLLKADPKNQDAALNLSQLYYQLEKYPDAADVLETALPLSPDSARIQFALGTIYLKQGQAEKALPHMRSAVEPKGNAQPDPQLLNNVAYTLAENNTALDLAKEYAEKAIAELDEKSLKDEANEDEHLQQAYSFSLVWDTLGWVYFQNGDLSHSESLVRSAWLLGQNPDVGEHLGEIYEKEGKTKDAAHAYELALGALGAPSFQLSGMPVRRPGQSAAPQQGVGAKILSRYKKLTGRAPSNEIRRLPNGEWTKTPGEQLSQMRTVRLAKQPGLSGSAEFSIGFVSGKVESVEFRNGEKSLQSLSDPLRSASYHVEFPNGSKARILRRAEVSCTPSAGCVAVLLPVDSPSLLKPASGGSQPQ